MRPTHATITGLHIYPVKSCRGISLATAEMTGRGLAHDREWMVVDAEGQFLTQRALPRMALIETALTSDTLRLTAPGQSDALELSRDTKHLDSARKAADWAATRSLCPNWNYNSFSVYLLAKAFAVTSEKRYLAAARKKALVGVIPGQLTDGPHAGRWMDAHNARPAYHYIMLRALGQLTAVMPKDDPDRAEILRSLTLGLRARNQEILTKGVMNKEKSIEALLLMQQWFSEEKAFLKESLSTDALDVLGKLVSEQSRRGQSPLSPREWGLFLEAAKRQSH